MVHRQTELHGVRCVQFSVAIVVLSFVRCDEMDGRCTADLLTATGLDC